MDEIAFAGPVVESRYSHYVVGAEYLDAVWESFSGEVLGPGYFKETACFGVESAVCFERFVRLILFLEIVDFAIN